MLSEIHNVNLPAASRTPIRVNGSIEGDQVVATFVEEGMPRPTNGRFTWKLDGQSAALSGTFVSAAANSSGNQLRPANSNEVLGSELKYRLISETGS